MMNQFTKTVDFAPSFNFLPEHNPGTRTNYGVGNMTVTFILKGPKGAVQWKIGTEWGIESVRNHLANFPLVFDPRKPTGWDLGYHSPKPMYDGQSPMSGHCSVVGGTCYYDGSSINADLLIEGFLAGGTDWLWPALTEYYRHVFEDAPFPVFVPVYLVHPDLRTVQPSSSGGET